MFSVVLMYSEKYSVDMWWVRRDNEVKGKYDYYGPFFYKSIAEKFRDNELKS